MSANDKILRTLLNITKLSNIPKMDFKEKLQRVLMEIVSCMDSKNGSIMILKNYRYLEVVASTKPNLIGLKQDIDNEKPSSWVVKNKEVLYRREPLDKNNGEKDKKRYDKDAFVIAPIVNQDKVIGVISVTEKIGDDLFTDEEQEFLLNITSHVISAIQSNRLTTSLKKSKNALQQKNKQLKHLEKLRQELFNMLVHDLKGPISEIVANLDILSYTILDEENREYIKTAQTGCDTLYRMISDLLDIARLEDGSLKLLYERVEPDKLIQEAFLRLIHLAKSRGVTLVEQFEPSRDKPPLYADRSIVLRILQNLFSNAIYYSPSNDTIEAGYSYINRDELRIYVKDNGPGVPDEFKTTIFGKFVQLSNKNDGRTYTTGLGLTFCQMAVEAHKGKIFVESDGEKGSCFFFTLPLQRLEK